MKPDANNLLTAIEVPLRQAVQHHRTGELAEAERLYREVLRLDPGHSDALHLLGVVAHQSQRPDEAIRHIERAIAANPHSAVYHNNFAAAHRAKGDVNRAVELYRYAVLLNPDYLDAWKNLGSLHFEQNELNDAAECYCRAVRLDERDADSWFRLGNTSGALGLAAESRECFERAVDIEPGHAEANFNLGNALRATGAQHEAIRRYRAALQSAPNFDAACVNLAATYCELGNDFERDGQLQQASVCFQQALNARTNHVPALLSLGNLLKAQDDMSGAETCFRKIVRGAQRSAAWELWHASLCPAVFSDTAAIDHFRRDLLNRLQSMLHDGVRLEPSEIATLGTPVPYNLQFHGRDDRPIKEAFASIVERSIQAESARPIGPPRVGFVVTAGHEGAFLRYMRDVLVGVKGARFERVVACAERSAEYVSREIADETITILKLPSLLEDAVEAIRRAEFDVLYHWEVGSDVLNYFLPFYRLAPVQCTSAGLPVTTGMSVMNYFLSHDLAEPAEAERHYSESLIRARTQLTCQRRMSHPAGRSRSRADFGVSNADHLYVCAQKVEKFHPDFDALLVEILRRDSRGRIVITRDKGGYRARKLQRRLATMFPDVVDRIVFVPRLELGDYLSLLNLADVVLDTLHYGGGLTAFDAFSFNKPIVTLPTDYVRGRYVHGFYRKMGIEDCTATTPEEYVSIAVALGNDSERRHELVNRISNTSCLLFDDSQSIEEYEAIFERLIHEARSAGSREVGSKTIGG